MKKVNKTEQSFEKTNEIKKLCLYVTIVNKGQANAVTSLFQRMGSALQYVEVAYTINVAEGAPTGASFTTSNGLTGSGNTYSITGTEITAANVADYVTANEVSGYETEITVNGTTITITYTSSALCLRA